MRRLIALFVLLLAPAFVSPAVAEVALVVTPPSLDLGTIQAPGGHLPGEATLTNTGTTDIAFDIVFPYPLGSIIRGADCFRSSEAVFVIHPGESCLLGLDLAVSSIAPPNAVGPGSSALQLVLNGERIVTIPLAWTIVPAYLQVDSTEVEFAVTQVGTTSSEVARLIRNNTDAPLDIGLSWNGLLGPDCGGRVLTTLCAAEMDEIRKSFVLDASGCHPIPAHGSCMLSIRFLPGDAFAMSGTFIVSALDNTQAIPVAIIVSGAAIPRQTVAGTALAIEYVNWSLGEHYFMTADPNELAALDAGHFSGWNRTGRSFWVFPSAIASKNGVSPVCRFYGRPEAGLDSHFYSASPQECSQVESRFSAAWQLESSDVFGVALPDPATGACPDATAPVYRAYNNRKDVNHRYVTDRALRDAMLANGWIAEGYGPTTVAMCAAQ